MRNNRWMLAEMIQRVLRRLGGRDIQLFG
jgi:hypothetical protein